MTTPTPRPGDTNGWAIAAFVLSILGGIILSVIFAIVALFQVKGRGQRGRGLAIASLAISALWVAAIVSVIAYGLSTRGHAVRAGDLRLGDCIKESVEGALPASVSRIRCDRPHFGEVFAILTIPDAPAYPGEQAVRAVGDDCGPQLFSYAPDIPEGPTFRLAMAYPTRETWDAGDRSVVCVATAKHERWQSIRGN